MLRIAQFIPLTKLPRKLGCFDYQIDSTLAKNLIVGQIIKIPFARRNIYGCFIGFIEKSSFESPTEIKTIETLARLDSYQLEFLKWFSKYNFISLGTTLALMQPPPPLKKMKAKIDSPNKPTEKNQKIPLPIQRTAQAIIGSTRKKYLVSALDPKVKFGFYEQLLGLNQSQAFVFFPDLNSAKLFYEQLPKELSLKSCLLIGSKRRSKSEFFDLAQKIKAQQIKIVIGTRSACFYLNQKTALVIADSIDSDDYKQWDQTPYYNCLDVIKKHQEQTGSRVVLVSPYPRPEDTYFCKQEQYQYLNLETNKKPLPRIVNMKEEPKRRYFFLSYQAEMFITQAAKNKKQVLLIFNKTGSFSRMVCAECGHTFNCPQCALPYSLNENQELVCGGCQQKILAPTNCPECGSVKIKGQGLGIKEIIKQVSTEYKCSDKLDNKQASIILATGTETVPNLERFAGIIVAYFDNLLFRSDFNTNYRLYRFLNEFVLQLKNEQQVIIQTYFPENDVIKNLSLGYASFFQIELRNKKEYGYPPFSRLIKVFFQHHDRQICLREATDFHIKLEKNFDRETVKVSEPYLYYLTKIRKRYRYIITIKVLDNVEKNMELLSKLVPDYWSVDSSPIDLL